MFKTPYTSWLEAAIEHLKTQGRVLYQLSHLNGRKPLTAYIQYFG